MLEGIVDQNVYANLISFRKELTTNCYSNQLKLSVSETFNNLIQIIVAATCDENAKITAYNSKIASVEIPSLVFVTIEDRNHSNIDFWTKYDRSVTIDCHGDMQTVKKVCEYLKTNVQERKRPTVSWEFVVGGDRESKDIKIEKAKPIYPELYPWIGDVYNYYNQYLASDSSILVLLGETGTAKTSFIRSMIWHASLNTMFTYEEELLKSDSLFVDFMVDTKTNLLVIENADLFLTSREHDGNKIMSKFLNVSDGLADIGKKKIIFTANITEPSKIDNALLRPGRMF